MGIFDTKPDYTVVAVLYDDRYQDGALWFNCKSRKEMLRKVDDLKKAITRGGFIKDDCRDVNARMIAAIHYNRVA